MTIIDYKSKLILKDMVVSRKLFDRNLIKEFIGKAVEGLGYHTIVTDGDKRYKKIFRRIRIKSTTMHFSFNAKFNVTSKSRSQPIKT